MKYLPKIILSSLFILGCKGKVAAQVADTQRVDREWITKATYPEPDHSGEYYRTAYSLNASGKGLDALPYLEKVFKSKTVVKELLAASYDLAGTIYTRNNQPQKAIEYYQTGVMVNPSNQSLVYNLGLAYSRNKQYVEAEKMAIEALKVGPVHTGAIRLYALACFHQNKRAPALLGFCSFILNDKNSVQSKEAYGNIEHILQGGVLQPEPGVTLLHDTGVDKQNKIITKTIAPFATRKYASIGDLLSAQLTAIFNALGSMPHDKQEYWYAMADYLALLAQSPNMPTFARVISMSTPESAKWIKENPQKMDDLDSWTIHTERGF